jgi:hypothetical protein
MGQPRANGMELCSVERCCSRMHRQVMQASVQPVSVKHDTMPAQQLSSTQGTQQQQIAQDPASSPAHNQPFCRTAP